MFGLHKHKRVEYARSLMTGGYIHLGYRHNGDHTIITYQCLVCESFKQVVLVGHILRSTDPSPRPPYTEGTIHVKDAAGEGYSYKISLRDRVILGKEDDGESIHRKNAPPDTETRVGR